MWREILGHCKGRRNPNGISCSSWGKDSILSLGRQKRSKIWQAESKRGESTKKSSRELLRFPCKLLEEYWSKHEREEASKSGKRITGEDQVDKSMWLTTEEKFVFPPYRIKRLANKRVTDRVLRECGIVASSNEL